LKLEIHQFSFTSIEKIWDCLDFKLTRLLIFTVCFLFTYRLTIFV